MAGLESGVRRGLTGLSQSAQAFIAMIYRNDSSKSFIGFISTITLAKLRAHDVAQLAKQIAVMATVLRA